MDRQSSTARRARTSERQQLAALLAAAFYDDPVWGPYFFPDQRRRLEGLTRFFAGELRQFMPHEQVWTIEDLAGVTVWAPPGHWQVPPRELLRRAPSIARAFGRGLPCVLRATTMDHGREAASRRPPLLPAVYRRCARPAGQRSWHRAAAAGARPLRHRRRTGLPGGDQQAQSAALSPPGFEVREELDLPNGPCLWTIWREPGGG